MTRIPKQPQFAPAPTGENVTVLHLNYWLTDSPIRTRSGLEQLMAYLDAHLPEALPRRYGLVEPPRERWEVAGPSAFSNFMTEHPDELVVTYAAPPVVELNIWPMSRGWTLHGKRTIFRCGYLQIGIDLRALEDDERYRRVHSAWLDICDIVEPFATNVEILDNWIADRGGRVRTGKHTDTSECGPFWFGIPRRLGVAFGLGSVHVRHWPEFASRAQRRGDVYYVDADDWKARRPVSDIVGEAPEAVRERPGRGRVDGPEFTTFFPFSDSDPSTPFFANIDLPN